MIQSLTEGCPWEVILGSETETYPKDAEMEGNQLILLLSVNQEVLSWRDIQVLRFHGSHSWIILFEQKIFEFLSLSVW